MADLSSYIKSIETASRGEQVRDSIIKAFEALQDQGGNASTLDGHPANDFVTAQVLQDTIKDLGDRIDRINGENGGGSVSAKLTYLAGTKGSIADAISQKGISVSDSDTFRSYADKIRDMAISSTSIESVDITENGTYVPSGDVAWNQVRVDVPQASLANNYHITLNGTYTAQVDGYDGYASVTVNVPGGSGGGGSSAPDTWSVSFFNGTKYLGIARNIPTGGSATFAFPSDELPAGKSFAGWVPEPINVRSNMTCQATFEDISIPGEISDSWETICANKGANYAIGEYKTLVLADVRYDPSADEPVYISIEPFEMQKVYAGEEGTTSTWLSRNVPPATANKYLVSKYGNTYPFTPKKRVNDNDVNGGFGMSDLYSYLNGEMFSALPEVLRNNIKRVKKYTRSYSESYDTIINNQVVGCRLWIPSVREIVGFINDTSTRAKAMETQGVIYCREYSSSTSTDPIRTQPIANTDVGHVTTNFYVLRSVARIKYSGSEYDSGLYHAISDNGAGEFSAEPSPRTQAYTGTNGGLYIESKTMYYGGPNAGIRLGFCL